ncbi:flexible cuticle protein 12 [Drosophila tropicalis]|nr:flexible cuticle protein 12 [Drosophila willistoni]
MAQILKYTNENMDSEGYAFSFETSDGISRQESAMLRHAGTPMEALEVQGSVNWIGPDGIHYKLNYLADENGFQPQGEHLPQLETARIDH